MWNLKSPAKVNIFLEIIGKKEGLHCLHSLFCKVDLYDDIIITPNEILSVVYHNNKIENDIITKTVSVLNKHFPHINTNFCFNITKNIPVGAGLGGGSSNAAMVINFLLEQNQIATSVTELSSIAKEIGSDVPFFLHNSSMILNGSASELAKPSFKTPHLYCVIAHAGSHLLTKNVFEKINQPYTRFREVLNFSDAISRANEMQTAANLLTNGLIHQTLQAIFHANALTVKMSGSGSACFALFKQEEDAQNCLEKAKERLPFCVLTKLI